MVYVSAACLSNMCLVAVSVLFSELSIPAPVGGGEAFNSLSQNLCGKWLA